MSAYLPPQTLPSSPTKNIGGGFRVPPQDIENEKALLGSIMLKQGALFEIEDMVRPDSFYAVKHRIICEAMLDLHRKNEPIDILSVASRLAEKKQGDALQLFERAIDTIRPVVEVRSKRVGGANYQVPTPVPANRQNTLAFRWIITAAHARKGRGMGDRLSAELFDILEGVCGAMKKKEDVKVQQDESV